LNIKLGKKKVKPRAVVNINFNEKKYTNWWYDKTSRSWASLIVILISSVILVFLTRLTAQDFVNASCLEAGQACEEAKKALVLIKNGYATLGLLLGIIVTMTGFVSAVVTIVGFNDTPSQGNNSGIFKIQDFGDFPSLYHFLLGFAYEMSDCDIINPNFKSYPTHKDYFDWSKIYNDTHYTFVYRGLLANFHKLDNNHSALLEDLISRATCKYQVKQNNMYLNKNLVLVFYQTLHFFRFAPDLEVCMRIAILETSELLNVKDLTAILSFEVSKVANLVDYQQNLINIIEIWERVACLKFNANSVKSIKDDFLSQNPNSSSVTFESLEKLFYSFFGVIKP
jgi:hypothetical protein